MSVSFEYATTTRPDCDKHDCGLTRVPGSDVSNHKIHK